ncbi:hypothetical protein OCU04_012627 [Sclerotinia nivalis]|uniref:Uncharacterized protein n=1 Tax=Sclerotinia nivalis TaxID=352851 RepID=A0A9X0ACR6_9HELO|nr:hypothetical protein OCU04_012627 [Sclerotinia nivalis]
MTQKTVHPFIQSINEFRSPRASFFGGKFLMIGDTLAFCRPHALSSIEQASLDALLLQDLPPKRNHYNRMGEQSVAIFPYSILAFKKLWFILAICINFKTSFYSDIFWGV